jgi:hypothetical protein
MMGRLIMTDGNEPIEMRVTRLERMNRALVGILCTACLLMCSVFLAGFSSQSASSQAPLRTRSLIIEDSAGRPRILMGAPIADGNAAGNPRTGLIINDASGVERFGLGLQESGRLVMGLDAPPGKGDDRNRERITLVADENGASHIRFLDRTTSIPARLYLDEQNRVWLEFTGTQANEIVRRRIGLSGDETTRASR